MESNSDKEMRNKLQGAEFPFDPNAWEQMEAMLDEKKDRKGFFWWWFGGVAACLLFVAGMFAYHQFTNSNSVTPGLANQTIAELNTTSPATSTTQIAEAKHSNKEGNTTKTYNEGNLNTTAVKLNKTEQDGGASSLVKNRNKTLLSSAKNELTEIVTDQKSVGGKKHSSNKLKAGSRHMVAAFNQKPAGSHHGVTSHEEQVTSTGLAEQKAATSALREPFDPISMNIKEAGLLKAEIKNDDPVVKKEEDDVNLKKLKKNIFHYSLGITANITGTTMGAQAGTSGKDAFSHTPSYMVGLTHDFMFFKRFAITNGILFSQTSFKVFAPKNTYGLNLLSYSSSITELAIPIGIKGYVYSKPKVRVYIATGVINHIKLKETFTYQYNNNSLSTSTADLLPAQTTFTGGQASMVAGYSNSGSFNTTTYEFSINHSRRYYASFYATAGAEFIVQRHFVLFAESLFYMSLEKAGIQNKYKYNLGLSGGFRYQF